MFITNGIHTQITRYVYIVYSFRLLDMKSSPLLSKVNLLHIYLHVIKAILNALKLSYF